MAGVSELSRILAVIWDRSQRLFPRTEHKKVLRWHIQFEEVPLDEIEGPEGRAKQMPYPGKWGGTSPSYKAGNIKWGEGQWGPGAIP